MKKPTKKSSTPITSTRHSDKRANIPTEELRDFVAPDEKAPKTILYPRDPSLDPQLVWKGKDEQDCEPLAVPSVPVYIQEKIHPQAIIENLRAEKAKGSGDGQLALFSDFNNIEFEDLVDFYHHEQNWSNRMILGDSLLVMTSLAEKEGLKGQVQMIYIDPPYGIKFGSNWQVSTRNRDVRDGREEDLVRQPEQIRAFRDTWEKGIHSYLSYLRDRLVVAHDLLTESGSVFVRIGDENVHLVRSLLDEVFGSENYCSTIAFQKTGGVPSNLLPSSIDFILWYAKSKLQVKARQLYEVRQKGETSLDRYDRIEIESGETRALTDEESEQVDLAGKRYQLAPLYSEGASSQNYSFVFNQYLRHLSGETVKLVSANATKRGKPPPDAKN
jgi:adenine-specific DNA-methyltransferase